MRILGFESSCDETAVSVVEYIDGRIHLLSDVVASQVEIHRLYGGVVPEIASRAHIEAISRITEEALERAGVTLSQIDAVAVTSHPGLIGALLVAVSFAKGLAYSHRLPLVEVDHMKAHVAASYLGENAPEPPFIAVALSGGHTSIYLVKSYTEYELLGCTRDDAIGEAFDKIGRVIGIPYPAGAGFDRLADQGFRLATSLEEGYRQAYAASPACADKELYLPTPATKDDTLDFSFSGLKTAAINLLHRYEMKGEELNLPLFAAKYTHEVVEAVANKVGKALDRHAVTSLVVCGGVAANSHLRDRLGRLCEEKGVTLCLPPLKLCGDNGAMVAAQGVYEYLSGQRATTALNARATDD